MGLVLFTNHFHYSARLKFPIEMRIFELENIEIPLGYALINYSQLRGVSITKCRTEDFQL